jgi:hypothetical protein
MDQPGAIDQCENDRGIRTADMDRWTAGIQNSQLSSAYRSLRIVNRL